MSEEEMAALIEKGQRMAAVDEEGCVKYPVDDEIVVCGTPDDQKSQRIFRDRGEADENRLRPGEAVSTKRAAACLPDDPMCIIYMTPSVSMGFGYVPPIMVPYEELMKGLPGKDMVVPEGTTKAQR